VLLPLFDNSPLIDAGVNVPRFSTFEEADSKEAQGQIFEPRGLVGWQKLEVMLEDECVGSGRRFFTRGTPRSRRESFSRGLLAVLIGFAFWSWQALAIPNLTASDPMARA
jgi:hypothetical protein